MIVCFKPRSSRKTPNKNIGFEFVSQVSVLTLKHNFVSCLIMIAKDGIVCVLCRKLC